MEKMNTTRGSDDKGSKDLDFDFYLKSGLPSAQVVAMLKQQGKDQKEVDAFMEKYEVSRKKIAKVVRKFVEKIEMKYGHLDVPDLIKKGMKHASKHDFSPAERDAFINFVMKGDTDVPYLPFQELGYTEMSKFLGFANNVGQTITVKATDHPALQEIARLYEQSKLLHTSIRQNLVTYSSFSINAMTGVYDKDKDDLNLFVHPLIVALFLPRIESIERRMLFSDIGRFVVQRTQMYFQNNDRRYLGWTVNPNDLIPGELEADAEFMYEIARDPNSLDHFSDESPMNNLLKRYQVQIELWKNVLTLRQGKYYSKTGSCGIACDDGIRGLGKVLSSYNWTYFDSPELANVGSAEEGTLLRKLLAVFSFRPTFTQISSFTQRSGLGFSNLGAVRATFVNTPICNLRLPLNLVGGASTGSVVNIESALSSAGLFIENKMLVPKNTTVIRSNQVLFFHVNRRYHSPLVNLEMGFRYMSVPGTLSALTSINTTNVNARYNIRIAGQDDFELTSVVVLNPLIDDQYATGCSALFVKHPNPSNPMARGKQFYQYNPLGASVMYVDPTDPNKFTRNDPITILDEFDGPNGMGFRSKIQKYGTIFIYVNPN